MNTVKTENYSINRAKALTGQFIVWECWHGKQMNVKTYYGETSRDDSWLDYSNRCDNRGEQVKQLADKQK